MHTKKNNAVTAQSGFTLVELAIVLVIIGLLVGGVLVGQDLIKAAAIRSTVSDFERWNAAANTFRGKYGGIPGDLLSTRATTFTLTTRSGAAGRGDGNGLVEGGAAAAANVLGYENVLFWHDLSDAGLIAQSLTSGTDAIVANGANSTLTGAFLPSTKLRDTTNATVFTTGGRNFFLLANTSVAAAVLVPGKGTGNAEAKSIDEKTDDGLPKTGGTLAISAITSTAATTDAGAAAATGVCVNTGVTPNDYNVGGQYANELDCILEVRTNF